MQSQKKWIWSRYALTKLVLTVFPYLVITLLLCACAVVCVYVSLFYVIDTGSTGSRTRHHVTSWGVPIYTHHP